MRLDPREALRAHAIARKLAIAFDPAALQRAVAAAPSDWWRRHAGPYHDGAWESISLWAPRGDQFEQRSKGGAFAATPALEAMPAFREVLAQFPADRNRVRLMRLNPGGHILRHSDPIHTIDGNLVRLHVPVVSNPDVRFLVNDRRIVMRPGETWHVDVRFPHEVANDGATTRVHLVMDLVRTAALDAMIDAGASEGSGWLTGYYVRHSLPGPLKRALRIGN